MIATGTAVNIDTFSITRHGSEALNTVTHYPALLPYKVDLSPHPCLRDEETEAWRGKVIFPSSHRGRAQVGQDPWTLDWPPNWC